MTSRNWSERIAAALAMDDGAWARHANPWSGWTRVAALPLLCLAIWSRAWIGWGCLVPVALALAWIWANPRAFPPPARTDGWISRAVLGERVWLARNRVPIPRHHALWARLLSGASILGLAPILWGLWALEIWPLALGVLLALGAKLWFLDRMVWLYDDMAREVPRYAAWRRPPAGRAAMTGARPGPISGS